MSKKTLALIVLLLTLTIILVFVAVMTKPQTTPQNSSAVTSKPTATPTPVAAHTTLMLSPNPVTATRGVPTTINVMIDTKEDTVRAVQLEIAYDPKALTNVSIKPGSFFTTPDVLPVGGINTSTGRITFAVTPGNIRDTKSGQGVVAIITATPTGIITSTPITVLDKSLVTSPGLGAQSVLKSVTGTTVTLTTAQRTITTSPITSTPPQK